MVNSPGVLSEGADLEPVRLLNPSTLDRQLLRLAMLPAVLDVVARNAKHTSDRLAFFELGRTFFHRPDPGQLPYERRTLAIALAGDRHPPSWQDQRPGQYSLFDLKGMIQAFLSGLRVREWRVEPVSHPSLHPGRAAALRLGNTNVGYLGELHPLVAASFELEGQRVQVAEFDLDCLLRHTSEIPAYESASRFPAVLRDLAVVVAADVPAQRVLDLVHSSASDLLETARIFDVYAGDQLSAGTKSVAISMTFRAPDSTLTQSEVGVVWEGIVSALKRELGATIRD